MGVPSVSEPFWITTLEAIQSNVPVIISKQSGVSEVITNVIKVDFWDIDAMADAIYGILNYPSGSIYPFQIIYFFNSVLYQVHTQRGIILYKLNQRIQNRF